MDDPSDDRPAAGGLWCLHLRYDEFDPVLRALAGIRLPASEADHVALVADRLEILKSQIEDQARGIGRSGG